MKRDTSLDEVFHDDIRNFGVFYWQDLRECFDHGDVASEIGIETRELHPDRTGPDDQQ